MTVWRLISYVLIAAVFVILDGVRGLKAVGGLLWIAAMLWFWRRVLNYYRR